MKRIENLPNKHINLGLRQTNVKVGEWTPPLPLFLEDLKAVCFSMRFKCGKITSEYEFEKHNALILPKDRIYESYYISELHLKKDVFLYEKRCLEALTNWYKTFQTIHFFEDLNGRIGAIIINIFSYLLTGKFLKQIPNDSKR